MPFLPFKLAFLGAGQAGAKLVQAAWAMGYRRVGAFNTTRQDFKGLCPDIPALSLDIGGARKDPLVTRKALSGRDPEVYDLLHRSWGCQLDYGLLCIGLGGGTGSGSALPLAKQGRKYMQSHGLTPRVGALVSLPSLDEGQQVARNALHALQDLLTEKVSPLFIVDNDKVQRLIPALAAQLFNHANTLTLQLVHSFNVLAASKSEHISLDVSELGQILESGIVLRAGAIHILPKPGPGSARMS